MIRKLRHRLRKISYYSRSRERSVWTRAVGLALPVTLALSLPVLITTEALVDRMSSVETVKGVLIGDPEVGAGVGVEAPLVDDDHRWDPDDGTPYGEWTLRRHVIGRGWPFASRTSGAPATVDLNLYEEARNRIDVRPAPDDPARSAIVRSLERADRTDLRDAWITRDASTLERDWLHTALDLGAWWVMLFFASALVIRTLALFALLTRAKRVVEVRSLTRTGICTNCKYDLRGLEFSARCPECGTLIE